MAESADKLETMGIQFYGRVCASISHEINNALAVLRESSGLISDYAGLAQQGRPLDPARLDKVAKRLGGQVSRAHDIVDKMNRFAHSGDDLRAEINLTETVKLLLSLHERLAARHRVSMELAEPDEEAALGTLPFQLEDLVWRSLEFASQHAKSSGKCVLLVTEFNQGAQISIKGLDPLPQGAYESFAGEEERLLMDILKAEVTALAGERVITLTFKNQAVDKN